MGSKRRRGAGADDFARLRADAAETMRAAAVQRVGIARSEHAALAVDAHLEAAADNHAALLALMGEQDAAGVGAGLVAFLEDLQRRPVERRADLAVGDVALADLGQLVG